MGRVRVRHITLIRPHHTDQKVHWNRPVKLLRLVLTQTFGRAESPALADRCRDPSTSRTTPHAGCGRGKPAVPVSFFRQHGGMLDVADYELVWPPELFAAEARRILARQRVSVQAIDLLLREAFCDDSAAEDAAGPGAL